jgi:hypothetical protein
MVSDFHAHRHPALVRGILAIHVFTLLLGACGSGNTEDATPSTMTRGTAGTDIPVSADATPSYGDDVVVAPMTDASSLRTLDVVAEPDGSMAQEAGDAGARPDVDVAASCTGTSHPVCLDFESGKLDAPWHTSVNSKITAQVESGKAAHGKFAIHFSNFAMQTSQFITTTQLDGLKDVMWGRFYLYMEPGAPSGHGALIRLFDQGANWYELGFEYNSYLGNWHPNGTTGIEKAMRSHNLIPKAQWACVEFLFDGAKPDVAQIWTDGEQVSYYSVIDYCNVSGCSIALSKAVQWKTFDIGVAFFHGTSLSVWAGDDPPVTTDVWIDDIALDTKRVGCL